MADICETSDELEPRRVCNVWVDGRLGGRAGEEPVFVRDGKAGGARRPGGASGVSRAGVVVERRGSAGDEPLSCAPDIDGLWATTRVPLPLFKPCASDLGRPGGGGGGGRFLGPSPPLEKFFCWLRAAIRSARELNLGSSTSAILEDPGASLSQTL